MEYNLRYKLKHKDIKIIESIVAESGFFTKDEIAVSKELAVLSHKQGAKKSGYSFIIIESNKKIIGFSCFGKISYTKYGYDLYWIVIEKSFRNSGIGKILINETERVVKINSGKKIYVETSGRDLYIPTRKFYESNNYVKVSEIQDYYDTNDSKVTYEKKI